MTSVPNQVRASGATQAEEVTRDESEENDKPVTADVEHETLDDPRSLFRSTGFSRMRFNWLGDDGDVVRRCQYITDQKLFEMFPDAYAIMNDLWDIVRDAEVDQLTGEVNHDEHGWKIWKTTDSGDYIEDWSKLTRAQREDFLFRITTRFFNWEQIAAGAWGEAMLAKAQWEEVFAVGYNEPVRDTIEGRTAKGRVKAADDRYFAIFVTLFSKKADALVKSMDRLSMRLRDALV